MLVFFTFFCFGAPAENWPETCAQASGIRRERSERLEPVSYCWFGPRRCLCALFMGFLHLFARDEWLRVRMQLAAKYELFDYFIEHTRTRSRTHARTHTTSLIVCVCWQGEPPCTCNADVAEAIRGATAAPARCAFCVCVCACVVGSPGLGMAVWLVVLNTRRLMDFRICPNAQLHEMYVCVIWFAGRMFCIQRHVANVRPARCANVCVCV